MIILMQNSFWRCSFMPSSKKIFNGNKHKNKLYYKYNYNLCCWWQQEAGMKLVSSGCQNCTCPNLRGLHRQCLQQYNKYRFDVSLTVIKNTSTNTTTNASHFTFLLRSNSQVYCSWYGPNAWLQGCISCGILLSGTWARGVSSEHMENMEMFSCSPT